MSTFEGADQPRNGNVLEWRVTDLTRNVQDLLKWKGHVDVAQVKQDGRIDDVEQVAERMLNKVDRLIFVVVTASLTMSVGLVTTGVSILFATGKL